MKILSLAIFFLLMHCYGFAQKPRASEIGIPFEGTPESSMLLLM